MFLCCSPYVLRILMCSYFVESCVAYVAVLRSQVLRSANTHVAVCVYLVFVCVLPALRRVSL